MRGRRRDAARRRERATRRERPARPGDGRGRERRITAPLTTAMGVSMLQLFLVSALGPRLVGETGVSPHRDRPDHHRRFRGGRAPVADRRPVGGPAGARRCLVALLLLAAAALALIGSASGAPALPAAVALGGLPQALANPATNKAVLAVIEPERRGAVTGPRGRAVAVLRELVTAHLRDGRLLDGCYDHEHGVATRHELVWGDFFLAVGLAILTSAIDLFAC